MKEEEFIRAVDQMRELQKRYFKERSSIVLAHCKKAEKTVDEMLRLRKLVERKMF